MDARKSVNVAENTGPSTTDCAESNKKAAELKTGIDINESNKSAVETGMTGKNEASGIKRASISDDQDTTPVQKKRRLSVAEKKNGNQHSSGSSQNNEIKSNHETDFVFTLNHPFFTNVIQMIANCVPS